MTLDGITDEIGICKLACDLMGERASSISSIENPTTMTEDIFSRNFVQARKAALRMCPWNFAQTYDEIAALADPGEGPYTYKYQMPEDLVRLNVIGEDKADPVTNYEIINREIHTDEPAPLCIWYNRDVDDVSLYDASFVDAFALQLAIRTVIAITKKTSEFERLTKLANEEWQQRAQSIDGQERPPTRIQRSKYLTARKTYGGVQRDTRYYDVE